MTRALLNDNVLEKVTSLALGCCIAGGVITVSTAAAPVVAGAVSLGTVLTVLGLKSLIRDKPECEKALAAVRKALARDLVQEGEADEADVRTAVAAFDAALKPDLVFTPEALTKALAAEARVVPALTAHVLADMAERDPRFAPGAGMARDLAERILSAAFARSVEACLPFKDRANRVLAEVTLDEVRGLGRTVAEGFEETGVGVRGIRSDLAELRASLEEQLDRILTVVSLDPAGTALRRIVQERAMAASPDFAEFVTNSNLVPEAAEWRSQAKQAMERNDIAAALRCMQEADDLERRQESETQAQARSLRTAADDAAELASAHSVSRARTQAALASVLMRAGDFERSISTYAEAIRRLPPAEAERSHRYGRHMRRALNALAATRMLDRTPGSFAEMRTGLFGHPDAARPDVVSFNILVCGAPTYLEARAVLAEMKAAGLDPDVVSYSTLMAQAPGYDAARAVLSEMKTAGVAPNVVSYSTLMARAPGYDAARAVLAEMKTAGLVPDVFSYSTLMAQAPGYDAARAILSEMKTAGVAPNVVSYSTLMTRAPGYEAARAILSEMKTAGVAPNVVSYSTLMARAPGYDAARAVLSEMETAGVAPNVVSYNTLMAQSPDFDAAQAILSEMKAVGVAPNVVSYNTLIAQAPDYDAARAVLIQMIDADVDPNEITASLVALHIGNLPEAQDIRAVLRSRHAAGTSFYEVVFKRLCPVTSAQEILDWSFTDPGRLPFAAFGAAIASYRRTGRLNEALRIASAFPHFEASEKTFKENREVSISYLTRRYRAEEEPHHAAAALGHCHLACGEVEDALFWLKAARDHRLTTAAKRTRIEALIEQARSSLPA